MRQPTGAVAELRRVDLHAAEHFHAEVREWGSALPVVVDVAPGVERAARASGGGLSIASAEDNDNFP